jgi:hypothetical protein
MSFNSHLKKSVWSTLIGGILPNLWVLIELEYLQPIDTVSASSHCKCFLKHLQQVHHSSHANGRTLRCLTTPRISKPPFADSADLVEAEIELSQRYALREHFLNGRTPLNRDVSREEVTGTGCYRIAANFQTFHHRRGTP